MKYVFFDIDGTLRGESRIITERTKAAIRQLKRNGHKAFVCTGRAPVSITSDILEIGFDGIISSAGSFIEIDGRYIFESSMDPVLLKKALLLFTNAKVGFTLETKDCLFQSVDAKEFIERRDKDRSANPELARMLEQRKRNENIKPVSEFDFAKDKPVTIRMEKSLDGHAYYSEKDRAIAISSEKVQNWSADAAFGTLIHEMWHGYQHEKGMNTLLDLNFKYYVSIRLN